MDRRFRILAVDDEYIFDNLQEVLKAVVEAIQKHT